ncbi:MAG: hypothetical protein D6790_06710, partial [Caldilineae bacterium]
MLASVALLWLSMQASVHSWLLHEWRLARQGWEPMNCFLRWTELHHIAVMQTRAGMRVIPDQTRSHVKAALLYYSQPNRWRLSESTQGLMWDIGRTVDWVWEWSGRVLHRYDPKVPRAVDLWKHLSAAKETINCFRFPGLYIVRWQGGWKLRGVEITKGNRWVATAVRPGSYVVELIGTWDDHAKRGFPREWRVVRGPGAGWKWTVEDWTFNNTLGLWLGRLLHEYTPRGELYRVLRLDEATYASPGALARAAAVPRPKSIDMVRGPVDLAMYVEHDSASVRHYVVKDGRLERVLVAADRQAGARDTEWLLRLACWLAVAAT